MQNSRQYIDNVNESAEFLLRKIGRRPEVLILSGTGLGDCIELEGEPLTIPYNAIPHFPKSTVKSHKNLFAFGSFGQHFIAVMRGRFHLYEGYTAQDVIYPIRVMQVLGVKTMVVTNSAGSLNARVKTGDVMVINDHINLTGDNPLMGEYSEHWGDMYPDMTEAYDKELQTLALDAAQRAFGDRCKSGVYIGLRGPSFETPAEVRFYTIIGGDCVGFSTVPEVIAAKQAQMRILGLSVITNSHHPAERSSHDLSDIIDVAGSCAPRIHAIVKSVLEAI